MNIQKIVRTLLNIGHCKRFIQLCRFLLFILIGSGIFALYFLSIPEQVYAVPKEKKARITVQVNKPGIQISPLLYGIFFEEVSRAGDGGLYTELIRNRDFRTGVLPDGFRIEGKDLITRPGWRRPASEIGNPLDGWSASGQGQISVISTTDECGQQGQAARFVTHSPQDGIINSGYYGIPVEEGKSYQLLMICRNEQGHAGNVCAELLDKEGKLIGQNCFSLDSNTWIRQEITLKALATYPEAKLRFRLLNPSIILVRYASLIPVERWNGLPVRADMAEKLKSLKPAFMRFPGGGFVHNMSLETGWNWKETIGPVERRPGRFSMWGYRSTDGLGYHEYLLFCEAMKMEAIPVVNIGISCMAFEYEVEPMVNMGRWVQDALDAIEYANGPISSTWGKVRAANGHPKSFNIKYLSIGNESGGEVYEQRYPLFYNAIKKKYPEIILISASHIKDAPMDMVDHHFYSRPEWFFTNNAMYDLMPRSPKIFVSELGSMDGRSQGNLIGALGEAVFMMGIERNSDLVNLVCYAPLFINTNHRNWPHSMFIHNNTMVYGTPSYHCFKMFSETIGDQALPCNVVTPKLRKHKMLAGSVGIGSCATQIEVKDVRVFSGTQPLTVVTSASDWRNWRKPLGKWQVNEVGALIQTGNDSITSAMTGGMSWNNYSYTLKVRKTGGQGGVIIYFAHENEGNNFLIHLGACGNNVAIIERSVSGKREEVAPRVPFTMETDRWYEVRIDQEKERFRCMVDGSAVFDLPMNQVVATEEYDQVFASASQSLGGTIYLRAVNTSEHPIDVTFSLAGVGSLASEGIASCLTGNEPKAENSFNAPGRISQQTFPLKVGGKEFTRALPPYSLSTFSIKQKK